MSKEKPWLPHLFSSTLNRPKSCLVCGEPLIHNNHPDVFSQRNEVSAALERPQEAIFDAQPKFPADGAARRLQPGGVESNRPTLTKRTCEPARSRFDLQNNPREDSAQPVNKPKVPESVIMKRSNRLQQRVLIDALAIFEERNQLRKDLWAQADPIKNLEMAREKMNRVEIMLEDDDGTTELVDDALDCINYMAFVIRKVTGMVPGE